MNCLGSERNAEMINVQTLIPHVEKTAVETGNFVSQTIIDKRNELPTMTGDCTQTSNESNLDATFANDLCHACIPEIRLLQFLTTSSTTILERTREPC